MATITIKTVKCIRKQDISGEDEPEVYIAGQKVWEGKLTKQEEGHPNETRKFDNSVLVELKERNGSSHKALGSWTFSDTPVKSKTVVTSSSGFEYELTYSVA